MPNSSVIKSRVNPENLQKVSRALGDATRLALVQLLAECGELCVCDIVDALELAQPLLSHHLRVLREAGLVRDRRQGRWAYYALERAAFEAYALDISAFTQSVNGRGKKPFKPNRCD